MYPKAIQLLVSFIFFWPTSLPVFALEQYQYVEMTGAAKSIISWEAYTTHNTKVCVRYGNTIFVNNCDRFGATTQWQYQHTDTEIHVKRIENKLYMVGTSKGQKVNRVIRLDDSPWFQPLSYSLRYFLASDQSSVEFWIIRSDNLSVIKMKAVKDAIEEIQIDDKRFSSHKIVVSPDGFAGYLWSGRYWYRVSDGLFLRYVGTKGWPGTPETTIELLLSIQHEISEPSAK